MKKLIVIGLTVAVAALAVYAGVARIDEYEGSVTATAYNSDRANASSSGSFVISNPNNNEKYTGLRGYVYVGAATVSPLDADSLAGVEGAKDTAIVSVIAWHGYDEDVIFCDTCADALPCTLFFDYHEGIVPGFDYDSSGTDTYETKQTALWLSNLRIDVQCADSAGSADTMQFVWNYWLQFIEEE